MSVFVAILRGQGAWPGRRQAPAKSLPWRSALESFIADFEACRLPKPRWTHQAHLAVGLWYLNHHAYEEALVIVRQRIHAYNESVGTANTDSGGYHETLTRLYLQGIAAHIDARGPEPLLESLAQLLQSPMVRSEWPLSLYTRERLFSVEARRGWVEPDAAG